MENEVRLDLFLHGNSKPKAANGRPDEALRDVLERFDFMPGEEQFVFIGESEEAVHDPEAESDVHEPVDIGLSLRQLDLGKHKHVHVSSAHRVVVKVNFNGVDHHRSFSPSTTVSTVTTWAKKRFQIDPSAGADLVLSLKPGNEHPRPDVHLGELLTPGSFDLVFDLVREVTPQG
jgi:hypothetical protein